MANLDEHPTVMRMRQQPAVPPRGEMDAESLRRICLDAGADDVGFVSIDRPEVADQREDILRLFPATRTCISLVCRMNPEPIRSVARSVSNLEFHSTGDHVNETARRIVTTLRTLGIRALNVCMGFPMEMADFPGKIWSLSHKPLAVAAGLGRMGLHRNVIHPRFGSFILLGAVLIEAEVATQGHPIDYNPCVECNLCVAACPVGAISTDGHFNFASCYTHNYREFMGGFTDWVERIAEAGSAPAYRSKVTDAETASMWQSLSFGANYKAAYCLSVCPAGEEVIKPFLENRAGFLRDVVKPLQQKREVIYVRPGSDAAAHVSRRFPHKTIREVGPVLRVSRLQGFLSSMQHVFQREASRGLDAVYHFHFSGEESAQCTVTIRDQKIDVQHSIVGSSNLTVRIDGATWIRFLRGEANLIWLLLTRKLKLSGDPRLLAAFGKCFP